MFNLRNWVWVGCLLTSVMAPVHAAKTIDAAAKYTTQQISISGTVNVNKDPSDNGVVPFGRYIFLGNTSYTGPERVGLTSLLKMGLNLTTSWAINIDGHYSLPIGNGFYIIFGIRDARGDTWSGATKLSDIPVISPGEVMISVVTDKTGTDFVGDFTYNQQNLAYIVDLGDNTASSDSGFVCKKYAAIQNNNMCAVLNINLNFHVANSTCQIITAHNMAFIWSSLSPSEISNGSAESKTAPVTLQCSDAGGIEPVAVTFTASGGTYDAAQGIVKTNLANLGLQLTWASNGEPVVMDKEITFPALSTSTEDLSVNAKPVQLGSTSVGGGSFSTQVTMNIEYR